MATFNHLSQQVLQQAFGSATLKCLLLDSGTPVTHDPDAMEFVDDLDGTSDGDDPSMEPGDASYSRQTLSGVSITQDDTDDEGVLDFDDITFSGLSTTNDIQSVVIYAQDGLGSAGTDDTTPNDDVNVLMWDDDSGDSGGIADLPISTNGSDLTISIDAEGGLNISTAL